MQISSLAWSKQASRNKTLTIFEHVHAGNPQTHGAPLYEGHGYTLALSAPKSRVFFMKYAGRQNSSDNNRNVAISP
jgi:hypothetical protein